MTSLHSLKMAMLNALKFHFALSFLTFCCSALAQQEVIQKFVHDNDVVWHAPGTNENDSMPIGNGDLAANVWTEPNGDLVLLAAKTDAWTELGKLVKLGRVRMRLSPALFGDGAQFEQKLLLEKGSIEIRSGPKNIRIWIDANHPVMHVETHLSRPCRPN